MRDDLPYSDWKHEVQVWEKFTAYEKKKRGPALFLSLMGSARAAAREIPLEDINKDDAIHSSIWLSYQKEEGNNVFWGTNQNIISVSFRKYIIL